MPIVVRVTRLYDGAWVRDVRSVKEPTRVIVKTSAYPWGTLQGEVGPHELGTYLRPDESPERPQLMAPWEDRSYYFALHLAGEGVQSPMSSYYSQSRITAAQNYLNPGGREVIVRRFAKGPREVIAYMEGTGTWVILH